jgi:hypothetical protein
MYFHGFKIKQILAGYSLIYSLLEWDFIKVLLCFRVIFFLILI